MIKKIWKLLLINEFYEKHKHEIPLNSFDSIGQQLMPTLIKAQESFKRDLTEDEVLGLYCSEHPTLTTANKATVEAYISNIRNETSIGTDVAETIFAGLWKQEVARVISEYGIKFGDGEYEDVDELKSYLNSIGTSFTVNDFEPPVDTDPMKLFEELNRNGKWIVNIPVLDKKIGKVSPGMFLTILGRPEVSKTACIVNMVAGRGGFAEQGAKCAILCNEEQANRTAGRAATCFNEVAIADAMANPSLVNTADWNRVRKNITLSYKADISIGQLENYIKTNLPDILILDQLDHVSVIKQFESGHERLGALYRKARELCAIYNIVMIAVSQASAEAEGSTVVTYSHAEGSKTAKAAASDIIIGIGKSGEDEGDCVLRYYTVSKNKCSGWRGTIVAKLIQSQSRLIA